MTDTVQKQHKIFYGWWIVGALVLITAYIIGIIYFGFTAIMDPIAAEFGWSYAQISLAASLRGMETGLLSPLVGYLLDRWSPRKLLVSGIVISAIGLFLLSRVNSLAAFYGTFIIVSIGVSASTHVLPMTVVGYWFKRRVSIATGIVASGIAFGGLLVPLLTIIVDTYGWRTAMVWLGIGALVICVPLSLVVRHKPEQYGYLPDGDVPVEPAYNVDESTKQVPEVTVNVKQVVKGSIFWHLTIITFCHILVATTVVTHIMTYLRTIDIDRSFSSTVASIIPLMSIIGRLSFGWFGDRFDKRWVMLVGLIFLFISMIFFNFISSTGIWLLVSFIVLFGLGYGGPIPLLPAIIREYFGTTRLGTILGFIMGITMIGCIIGPPMTGWVLDTFGSYKNAWFAGAGITVIGIISLVTLPPTGNTTKTAHSS